MTTNFGCHLLLTKFLVSSQQNVQVKIQHCCRFDEGVQRKWHKGNKHNNGNNGKHCCVFWFVAVNQLEQAPTEQSAQSVANKVDCGKATNVSDQLQHLKASTRCKGNHKCPKQFVALEKVGYVQTKWYVHNHVQDVLARIKKDVSPVVLLKQRNKAIVGKLPLLWPGHFAKEVVGVGDGNFHVAFESYQPHQ